MLLIEYCNYTPSYCPATITTLTRTYKFICPFKLYKPSKDTMSCTSISFNLWGKCIRLLEKAEGNISGCLYFTFSFSLVWLTDCVSWALVQHMKNFSLLLQLLACPSSSLCLMVIKMQRIQSKLNIGKKLVGCTCLDVALLLNFVATAK